MLHRPALSGIGWATAFAIFSLTSCTIASADLPWIWFSIWVLMCPPWQITVTSVIDGRVADVFGGFVAWGFDFDAVVFVVAIAVAYDCRVRFI